MVTLADGSGTDSSHSLAGDALVLCSALLYSCYTVMMRKQLHHDDTDTPALFFGHIGLMTALLGLPVLLGCQLFGLVDVWVLEPKAVALAGINGGCGGSCCRCSSGVCHAVGSGQQHLGSPGA